MLYQAIGQLANVCSIHTFMLFPLLPFPISFIILLPSILLLPHYLSFSSAFSAAASWSARPAEIWTAAPILHFIARQSPHLTIIYTSRHGILRISRLLPCAVINRIEAGIPQFSANLPPVCLHLFPLIKAGILQFSSCAANPDCLIYYGPFRRAYFLSSFCPTSQKSRVAK